ncbi:hypothetical protein XELAEV_18026942mg [Xenopus laevis]|uniref:Uncharacterized protein n=1 Tax=Xenopus laevis TaxID=8355 RepID=A0A974HJ76_XENLA|nr:hypothetical protein XELAEV_18026942mg [Xenopus laevis]
MEGGAGPGNAGRGDFLSTGSGIFSARERQAADVFSDVGGDELFLYSDTDDTTELCKRLERSMIKEMRLWWDISTLENYLKVGRIPRGLRIRKFPAFSDVSKDFVEAWNNTLSLCSSKLMELIIDFHAKRHTVIQSDIKEVQFKLLNLEAKSDTAELLNDIKFRVHKLETDVKRNKREKFLRDKRDYELNRVYDWNIRTNFSAVRSRFPRKQFKGKPHTDKKVRFRDPDNYTSEGTASSSSYLYTEGELSQSDSEDDTRRQEPHDYRRAPLDRDRVKTRSQPGAVDARGLDRNKNKNKKKHNDKHH